LKTAEPIEVSRDGDSKVTSERDKAPSKQELPTCNRDGGKLIDSKETQKEKAPKPNSNTCGGDSKTTVVKA
jgi:hypothetical protein